MDLDGIGIGIVHAWVYGWLSWDFEMDTVERDRGIER